MAGNTKNGKTPAAPAKKVAEKAPVAKAAPTAAEVKPVAAKPADTKPALKTAAPSPKPAVAPVAKPVEAKPAPVAPKAEVKTVAPAKATATVSFGASWKQTVEGELVSGGQVTLSYDPSRAQLRHKNGDKPAWGVQAFVKLVPSGQLVEQPAVDFNGSGAKARPVTVELPKGTTEIQVWFKNWASAEKPGEAWDSNFGLNYKFAVRA